MDRTHRIDSILCLAKSDGHCGGSCLPTTYGWLILQDPDLVQGVNTHHWMDRCLPTLVDPERIIARRVPTPGLTVEICYYNLTSKATNESQGSNTMLGDRPG